MAKLVLKDREWVKGRSSTFSEDGIFRLEAWTFGEGYWHWEIRPCDLFACDDSADGPFRGGTGRTRALAIAAAEAVLLEEIGKVVEINEEPTNEQ